MEIDLNNEACVNSGECEKENSSSCSSDGAPKLSSASIYVELWHACAGPLTSLPKNGNVLVYFPQGHMEQAAPSSPFPPMEMPTFDLPSQIFCRVLDVQLLANNENDEVYTQLSLLPLPELSGVKLDGKEGENEGADDGGSRVVPAKSTSHMFCKTLTVSDTSTHGGFSVPRRAAEDCFPLWITENKGHPKNWLPKTCMELSGSSDTFTGPRRHLLTTGWSIFVSQKNLVCGDAVLFLRGEAGELHLGIRRAARPRNCLPDSINKHQDSYPNVLSPVANALSSNSMFSIFCSPRASHASFIIPYQKYVKCTTSLIPVGTRFRMRFDYDDSTERRFSGMVTGVGDMDPYRWPNSKWRCLMVRWDEDIMSNHQERVSPWDIDFSGNHAPMSIQSSPRMKKLRSNLPMTPHGSQIAVAGPVLDFEESVRSTKVLQGQENVALPSPFYRADRVNRQLDFEMQPMPPIHVPNRINFGEFFRNHAPASLAGFLESNWFPKVLQGQEICSFRSPAGKADPNLSLWSSKPQISCNVHMHERPTSSFYPVASEGTRNQPVPHKGVPLMLSNLSNFQSGNDVDPTPFLSGTRSNISRSLHLANDSRALEKASPEATISHLNNVNGDSNLTEKDPICKIFGFSLTEDPGALKRSCTKVHKQGSLVGRAIDLSRLRGYDDLLTELERLFSMEGLLREPINGWHILYTDSENDMMVVGDDPWYEFVEVATKIHIYAQEEVEKLTIGMNSEDTRSCLEEAPLAHDVSKSSSVGQPEYGSDVNPR